jgi:hypothetical protein
MQKEKIIKTLNSALGRLDDAIVLHVKGNEEKVIQLTWKVSSDLEYALFLFSFEYSQENRKPSKLSSKQPEIEQILLSTRDTLKEASKNLGADDLNEAHKKTWMAKDQLLTIHDFFEKKGRKNRNP